MIAGKTLGRLEALPEGHADVFHGLDRKDYQPVTVEVNLEDGVYVTDACWGGDRETGVDPFKLRRTFTKASYAAEWIDIHFVEDR